jgi:hypothetical protein
MTRCLLAALGCLCLSLAGPGSAAEKWWDRRWEARIPIVVKAVPGETAARPVILAWGTIAGDAAKAGFRLGSLRLVQDGRLVPFQVDHRDAAGHFLGNRDVSLDPQDEIVFVAPAAARTVFHLYLSTSPMPPAEFPAGVSARPVRTGQGHCRLATADLVVEVQGTGLADLAASSPANLGQAAVIGLTWKGHPLTGQANNWSVVMNACPFPSSPENRWQAVQCVVDGPVRKTVRTACSNSTLGGAAGTPTLQADVTRYFSVFAGAPLYDVEDVIECRAAQGDWTGTYTDRLIVGHPPQLDDVLLDGSAATPRRVALTDRSIPLTPGGRFDGVGRLVETANVNEGWYAWLNEQDRIGVAVFYGAVSGSDAQTQPAQVSFAAGWAMWSMENWISFVYRDLRAPTRLRHRFRVVCTPEATSARMAAEYHLWAGALGGAAAVGAIERRGP